MSNSFYVFPVNLHYDAETQKVVKRPAIPAWQDINNCVDTDSKALDELQLLPGKGIGVVCGEPSNLVVIDIDVKDRSKLVDIINTVPGLGRNTLIVQTQSGGLHFYYRCKDADRVKTGTGLVESVDVRAKGGFVVGPASTCQAPEGLREYKVVSGSWDTIQDIPVKLWSFLRTKGFIRREERAGQAAIKRIIRDNTELDLDRVRECLRTINIQQGDYATWFSVACALNSENLYMEFLNWSATQPGYKNSDDCAKAWSKISSNRVKNSIGIGSLFHLAKEHRWSPETNNKNKKELG